MKEGALQNAVGSRRAALGLTQGALAERVGVSRQTISSVEAGKMVPSMTLALQLAKALGVEVDVLFWLERAQGEEIDAIGEVEVGTRVVVGRNAGQWAATAMEEDGGEWAADGVVVGPAHAGAGMGAALRVLLWRPSEGLAKQVLAAGCAPALGVWAQQERLGGEGEALRWVHTTTGEALGWLSQRRVHVAGIHLGDEAAHVAEVKKRFPGRRMLLVNLMGWRQGLFVAKGNPLGLKVGEDLGGARSRRLRVVLRSRGAAARTLWDRVMGTHTEGLQTVAEARHHTDAARWVRYGGADVGMGAEVVAASEGVGFVAHGEERFDLVMDAGLAEWPVMRRALDALNSWSFRRELQAIGGYETAQTGSVRVIEG